MFEREQQRNFLRDSRLAASSDALTNEINSSLQDPQLWGEISKTASSGSADLTQFPSADNLLAGFTASDKGVGPTAINITYNQKGESFGAKLLDLPVHLLEAFKDASGISMGQELAMEVLKNPEPAIALATTAVKLGLIV